MNSPVICMIAATLMEAEPCIKSLNMEQAGEKPFKVYRKENIFLVLCGIGKANAAMGTAYCCMKYHPDCIINAGAAGSVDEACEVGKIFQIEKTIEPDRPHLRSNTPWVQIPDTLEGFDNAVLATQDKPVNDTDLFRELSSSADLVDMEGASVLQASKRFGTKCFLFKFVSDTPEHAGRGLIIENIRENIDMFCGFVTGAVIPRVENLFK